MTDKFVGTANSIAFPQCHNCKHYKRDSIACDAFPRIPIEIYTNDHDHRQPFEGDNGIQFEPVEADDK